MIDQHHLSAADHRPESGAGFALIAVLWALMLAGLILVGVQQAARVTLATGYNELALVQAHWLARAGVEQALAELAFDDDSVDSSLDYWYDDPLTFESVELGAGRFSVIAPPGGGSRMKPRFGLEDTSARLNVNVADRERLERLELLDDGQIDAILDWRTSENRDGDPRPGGAGEAHYQQLRFPYRMRRGALHTLKELRLIRGIDESIYFGEGTSPAAMLFPGTHNLSGAGLRDDDPRTLGLARLTNVYSYVRNRTGTGGERVDVNRADAGTLQAQLNFSPALAQAVIEARQFDSLMGLLDVRANHTQPGRQPQSNASRNTEGEDSASEEDQPIDEITIQWLARNIDYLTLTEDERLPGRININTASRVVLLTLPGVSPDVADGILAFRESSSGPFRSVGELLELGEVDEEGFKAVAEHVSVNSSVFQITSVGVTGRGIRQQIVAVVDRHATPMRILYWYQSE